MRDMMSTSIQKWVIALAGLFLVNITLANLPKDERVPGGIAVVYLEEKNTNIAPTVTFEGKRVAVVKNDNNHSKFPWVAVLGIPLSQKPGVLTLQVTHHSKTIDRSVKIVSKNYPTENFKIDTATMGQIESVENAKRLEKEKKILEQAYSSWNESTLTSFTLHQPVKGPIKGLFGARRVINGEPRNPHRGIDIVAATGTPIRAAKEGKIIIVGHYLVTGKTVMMDHGHGFKTIYCHLSEISVKNGDMINTGHILGKVGSTGRSSGPHLHFGVSLNNERVAPELFFAHLIR
jgi:murein DD-endopeptidase MepM/ murein hydrolase activator NlpD